MRPALRAAVGLGIGLGLALLLFLLRETDALARPELALVDMRTEAFVGTREADPRIVLAVVGDADIKTMAGQGYDQDEWPWTQDVQAAMVVFLAHAKATALALDFYYFDRGKDPEEFGAEYKARTGQEVPEYRMSRWQGRYYEALELGKALKSFGPVAIGFELTDRADWERPSRVELAETRWLDIEAAGPPATTTLRREGANLPVKSILEGARWLGFANIGGDRDGVLRRSTPAARWKERLVPSLALASAALLHDVTPRINADGVHFGPLRQPLSEDGTFLLNYRGQPYQTYRTAAVYDMVVAGLDLMEGKPLRAPHAALAKELEGSLVIWGASYAGADDIVATTLDGLTLGPEVHAVMVDNLLHGDGRVPVSRTTNALVLFLLGGLLGVLGTVSPIRWLPPVASAAALCGLLLAGFLLFRDGTSIDMFGPGLLILLTALATSAFRILTEGRRNKWLEQTFSRYLAPDVIEALKGDPSRLQLGGRRTDLTVFFSDVAGFTSISEKLGVEDVVQLLNRYLTGQSDRLMAEAGVIDKFEGDAIMAFFGDPLDAPDHAVRGCRAAVRCMAELPKLEPLWRSLGLESFAIRIGLNSGPALVGNMGSEKRFDYTCMGDTVNLASRLEGANKAFGSLIMIGPQTYEAAKDEILAKPLADLVVVGKSQAVAVYELVSMREDASEADRGHVEAYQRAHSAVRAGEHAAALAALGEAEALRPGDGPCRWLRGVIEALEAGELASPWDGRWTLDRK
jgi:adenylate cyclase